MKDVLVLAKITTFQKYFIENKNNSPKITAEYKAFIEHEHNTHSRLFDEVIAELDAHKINHKVVYLNEESSTANYEKTKYSLIVTIGGDGTFLAASHHVKSGSILGIKSTESSIGYLCAADKGNYKTHIKNYLEERQNTKTIQRLAVYASLKGAPLQEFSTTILNDVLYSDINPAATTRYLVSVNDKFERHRSSGIWISTSVGSTAAIEAAGGINMSYEDKRIQYKVRELYKRNMKQHYFEHGFIDLQKDTFKLTNYCDLAMIAIDGKHSCIKLYYGDQLVFKAGLNLSIIV